MKFNRQTVSLTAAFMLPLLILVGFQLYSAANARRLDLEAMTKARVDEISRLVDERAIGELKLATALASASSIRNDDIAAAYARAQDFIAVSGSWRAVRLSDPIAGVELFDTRHPLGRARVAISPDAATQARAADVHPTIDGIARDRDGVYAIALNAPVLRAGRVRYILTAELDPDILQRIVVSRAPNEGVVALVDRQGRFIARNLNYADRLGQPASISLREAIKHGAAGFYRGHTLEGLSNYTAYATAPKTGWSAHIAVSSSPFDAARRWSAIIWASVVLGCLALAALFVALTLRDIAESRREDERLRQSQKMEAVGHLTGGIAHDFNNLLTAIIGGLDLVIHRLGPDDRNRRYIEGALDAAQRGAKLTSRLLAFSRTQRLGVESVDIAATLRAISELLDQSLGPHITVVVDIADDAHWVRTDPNQLELALLNLAVNARDAMMDGGVLTVAAKQATYRHRGSQRPCVDLTVADTGTGMEPRVVEHAFDPFFTTKAATKGTGLGLPQVYALVKQSDGDAKIESEVGKGTTVHLYLPVAEPPAIPDLSMAAESTESAPTRAGSRILVLDDDDSVREVLVEGLRAHGYVVFHAASGEEALNILEEINPDLFVLDFLMPGMNGAEVAKRARAMRPHQKLLIVSGHLDNVVLEAAVRDVPILQKPFDGPTLARRLSDILDA